MTAKESEGERSRYLELFKREIGHLREADGCQQWIHRAIGFQSYLENQNEQVE